MSLIEDVLNRYLYLEEVQDLARERALPTSRRKSDMINALLESGRFDPEDALAYPNVTQFRQLCRAYRLDRGGTREEHHDKVLEFIYLEASIIEDEPAPEPSQRLRKSGPSTDSADAPRSALPSRVHPETTGAWNLASIVVGGSSRLRSIGQSR